MRIRRRSLERGQGLVEYALILVLVSIIVVVILSVTGKQVAAKMCDVVLQLGGTAPDWVEACAAPRITFIGIAGGQSGGPFFVEAQVRNNHGVQTSGMSVDFYVDGVLVNSEHVYRYCLVGGDSACDQAYNPPPGQHTLRAVATDSSGRTGEMSVTFSS